MSEEPPPYEWEVAPYSDGEEFFALYVSRGYTSTLSGKHTPHEPRLYLSNQSDCEETIDLRTVEDIDKLMSHLRRAREWLAGCGTT